MNLLFAALQVVVPVLGYADVLGRMEGAEFQTAKTPVVPAGYAFSIWSLIFLGLAVYAVEQARPSRRTHPGLRRIGWWTALAMAVNTAWSALAQLEVSLVILVFVFLPGVWASLRATRLLYADGMIEGLSGWRVGWPVAALAGWTTVALAANVSVALQALDLGDVLGREVQAMVLLSAAGALAFWALTRARAPLAYLAGAGWALAAVIVANLQRESAPSVAAAAAAWIGVLAIQAWRVRRRRPTTAATATRG